MEHNCDENIWFDYQNKKWYLRVEGNSWDYSNDSFEYTDIELNYCHVCGIDLNNKNT
ncbi:hypothetical protein SAMN04487895_101561 [Paenibacillus sophorae]|uniref:Uncharacterized protein n=1 Tax=Paenibacillus sophorae TaxID=1333845 RepID=A0A1H8GLA4_9BACL|nr:hypothetical protein [Paenibacillus sophorae]QWU14265.1 hypothetical protein KP014_20370 [Paenibacillus sophorae]SEN44782.1 hypothetical protein SAMN04487895_101561 [Paenibacillus sophorae]